MPEKCCVPLWEEYDTRKHLCSDSFSNSLLVSKIQICCQDGCKNSRRWVCVLCVCVCVCVCVCRQKPWSGFHRHSHSVRNRFKKEVGLIFWNPHFLSITLKTATSKYPKKQKKTKGPIWVVLCVSVWRAHTLTLAIHSVCRFHTHCVTSPLGLALPHRPTTAVIFFRQMAD